MGEILSLGVVRRTETGSTRGRCRQTSTVKTDHEGGETSADCLFVPNAWWNDRDCPCLVTSSRTAGTMARGAEDGDGQHAGGMPADLDSKS